MAVGNFSTRDPAWVRDYRAAQTYFSSGQYDHALQALDASLLEQPQHADALILRARTRQQLGRHALAAADYFDASRFRADPALLARRGYCLCMANSLEEAISAYEVAIAGGLSNARVFHNLGVCHDRRSDYDKAEEAFTRAMGNDSQLAIARFGRALVDSHRVRANASYAPRTGLCDIQSVITDIKPCAELWGTAAVLYAACSRDNPDYREEALRYLEQAVLLGFDLSSHLPTFREFEASSRFQSLKTLPPKKPSAPIQWFLDPFDGD
jgi:tetratricopeptide (TPR) repeat protein